MEYLEFDPLPEVAAVIRRVWTLEGHAGELDGEEQPVMPDGHPELVMHLGDPFERLSGACSERQPLLLLAGQMIEQLTLRPTGRMAVVGLRFRPFGLAAVLRTPLCDLTGLTLGIDDLDPRLARALNSVRDTTGEVAEAARLAQRVVAAWMDLSRIDPRLRAAVGAIARSHGLIGMDDVSRVAGMTRRHLERRFSADVGISPKRLARITRFQKALRLLQAADGPSPGTATAAECGYADQSHFIRDFRDLSGSSPSQHQLRCGQLTGFFI